jgi:hypothetical protein
MSTHRVVASGTVVRGRAAFNSRAIAPGESAPLGARVTGGGVNFSLFSRDADLVELLLFDGPQAIEPAETIPLDSRSTAPPAGTFVPGPTPGRLHGTGVRTVGTDRGLCLVRTRSCSIPMGAPSPCLTGTTAARRAARATTPPSP